VGVKEEKGGSVSDLGDGPVDVGLRLNNCFLISKTTV
jgi:hypothetical protein